MNAEQRKWEFLKDVVVPIIMGVCSIIVAISANQIARSSNETAQLQALIAKNAEAPTIEVNFIPGGYKSEDCIKISILDGKYSNFEYKTVSFLSFHFTKVNENGKWEYYSVDIPMNYYLSGFGSSALYGEIWELRSDFTAEAERLCAGCKEYFREGNFPFSETRWMLSDVSVLTCLKCTYLNLLEEKETVYYTMGSGQLNTRISQERGEGWFQKSKDMLKDGFFLYSDTLEQGDVNVVVGLVNAIEEIGTQYVAVDSEDW